MTYGWAILIIAVVMVALFSLGILGGSPLSTTCLPQSGYQCSGVTYSHGASAGALWPAGNVVLTIGQTTGTNWLTANFFYVAQGTAQSGGVPTSIPAGGAVLGTNLAAQAGTCPALEANANQLCSLGAPIQFASGQTSVISLPVSSPATNAGSSASGAVWASYTTSAGGPYYVQVATITLKAV